jgi:hypothetical protein
MKVIEWRIRPGLMINEEEVVRSLKERGYYSSGIQQRNEATTPKSTNTPRKRKLPPWPPKWVRRRMDRESLERFYADREKLEKEVEG